MVMSPTPFYQTPGQIKRDEEVATLTKCTNCLVETGAIYIHCESCFHFDLCLQCFASGAEIGQHKRYHSYRIRCPPPIGTFSTPDPWTLTEEHLLLYAIDDFGYGNWNDCARLVPGRSPDECQKHFETFYLEGVVGQACFPNPKPSNTVEVTETKRDVSTQGSRFPPPDASQLLGFSSQRNEFDIEYDNNAEGAITLSVAHLEYETVGHDMEDLDLEFKLARLDHYRRRLIERERRKHLVTEYGLLGWFSRGWLSGDIITNDFLPSTLQPCRKRSFVFQKLLPLKKFREFFASLQEAAILKAEIRYLQEYRLHRLSSICDVIPFLIEKSIREMEDHEF